MSEIFHTYFPALVGLAGAFIGGFTSFGTSWITQHNQLRQKRIQTEHAKRERLYSAFIDEASRLFADALGHERADLTNLVKLYALVARMRLIAAPEVVETAEAVVESIVRTYREPIKNLQELRLFAHGGGMDPLLEFSASCRNELVAFHG